MRSRDLDRFLTFIVAIVASYWPLQLADAPRLIAVARTQRFRFAG